MKIAIGMLLATIASALSLPAAATQTEWRFNGAFTDIDPGFDNLPPQVGVGLPFSVLVSFDRNAALLQKTLDPTDGAGYRYRYSNAALSMTFTAGSFGPVSFGNEIPTPIIVRDNFAVNPLNSNSPSVDGIFFGLIEAFSGQVNGVDFDTSYSVAFRSFDLGLYNITDDKIPTQLPPNFDNMQANFFQACRSTHGSSDSTFGCVTGELTSVSAVPEPSTYAMLALGLGSLGFASRRRRSTRT